MIKGPPGTPAGCHFSRASTSSHRVRMGTTATLLCDEHSPQVAVVSAAKYPSPGLFTSACAQMMAFDDNIKQGQCVVIDPEGWVKASIVVDSGAQANLYNNVVYMLCHELYLDN